MAETKKSVLLGITGSIAAYKAADLAHALVRSGYDVDVVMTKNATKFITPLTFETLTNNAVHVEAFKESRDFDVEHVSLAKKADVFVIAPATANMIAKLAGGIADDLLSTVAAACYGKPAIVCPAMNTAMYENPITQANIEKLKAAGYTFVGPRTSLLACGDTGKGAMAKVDDIIGAISNII